MKSCKNKFKSKARRYQGGNSRYHDFSHIPMQWIEHRFSSGCREENRNKREEVSC